MDDSLIKRALLGTDRTEKHSVNLQKDLQSSAVSGLFQKIGGLDTEESWKLLLEAGISTLSDQAGYLPEHDKTFAYNAKDGSSDDSLGKKANGSCVPDSKKTAGEKNFSLFLCAEDPRPELPLNLTRVFYKLLQMIVSDNNVPEKSASVLLRRIASVQRRLPEVSLPALLQFFSRFRFFKNKKAEMSLLLGETGRWLGSLNPDWKWCRGEILESDLNEDRLTTLWTEGTFGERKEAFSSLRKTDPDKARDLLEETWKKEKADQRDAFLQLLTDNIGPLDIPFLEKAASDRSSAVRETADSLLTFIPESGLARRMTRQAEMILAGNILKKKGTGKTEDQVNKISGSKRNACSDKETSCGSVCENDFADLSLSDRTGVELTPPPEFTSEMKKDGLSEKSDRGLGDQAWRFYQIVARVPVEHWEKFFGRSPEEIVKLYRKDDFFQVLLCAWSGSLKRFGGSAEWFEMIWPQLNKKGKELSKAALQFARGDLIQFAVDNAPDLLKKYILDLGAIDESIIHSVLTAVVETEPIPWNENFCRTLYNCLMDNRVYCRFIIRYLPLFPSALRIRIVQAAGLEKNPFRCSRAELEKIQNELALCRNFDHWIEDILLGEEKVRF